MKAYIIALIAFGCLFNMAQANDVKNDAKVKLEQARDKYKKGEEAEAIDICREAAKLGSVDAQVQVAAWLLERSLPKETPAKASKSLKEAEKAEQTVVNILEQEIAALMKKCQQCQSSGEMTEEQMQLMMQLMAMAGMKPGQKPGQKPGEQPGMNNSGGTTNKTNEKIPGSVNGAAGTDRKTQKLAGRNTQLPKEFQNEFKEFFKGVDLLRKNK
jgi:hypothetical protein